MKTFEMRRGHDESNVSGTGLVLKGCIFDSGMVMIEWNSALKINSWGMYKNYFDFYTVHVGSHPTNNTQVIFNESEADSRVKEKRKICRYCKNEYKIHPKDLQWSADEFVRSCSGNLVELH